MSADQADEIGSTRPHVKAEVTEKLRRIEQTSARFPESTVAQDALYAATVSLALVREVERITQERDALLDMKPGIYRQRRQIMRLRFGDQARAFNELGTKFKVAQTTIATLISRADAADAEVAKLRARLTELEGAEEAAESVEDEQRGQESADKAVMSLEAMAFNWIATTDIHKAIAAAAKIAGSHAGKLGSCIHGLVSQAWIEGAGTGFDARRKLTVAAREQIAELEQMFDMTREADRRGVDMWRAANPGNEMVLPDRGDLVAWLVEQLAARGSDAR